MCESSWESRAHFDQSIGPLTQLRQHVQLLLAPKPTKAKTAKKRQKTSAVAGPVKRSKR